MSLYSLFPVGKKIIQWVSMLSYPAQLYKFSWIFWFDVNFVPVLDKYPLEAVQIPFSVPAYTYTSCSWCRTISYTIWQLSPAKDYKVHSAEATAMYSLLVMVF